MRIPHAALFLLLASLSAPVPAVEKRSANDGQLLMEDVPDIPDALRRDLRRYENTRSAALADWDADGKRLYVRTRFGEVDQLHRVARPGAYREQLTFFDEPIGSVVRRPGHRTLAYTRDAGGNENAQIFLFDPDSGESRLLSDGESRNGALVWSRDGSQLAFQSTRRNGAANDIWIVDPEQPEQARLAWAAPGGNWWGPADCSRDGWLLVQEYVSSTDSRVHLLDPISRKAIDLHDGKPAARRYAVGFGRDDETVFYLSDEVGEFTQLVRRELESGEEVRVGETLGWDIERAVLSRDRKHGVLAVNAGGLTELYRFDTRRLRLEKLPEVPVGVITRLALSDDGERLALTIDSPTSPGDTYVYDLDDEEIERWTFSEVGGLDTSGFVEPETIRFPSFDGLEVPAFVYTPAGEGPHPVIVAIHGGPEAQARPRFSSTYQLWLAKLGAAVIVPNVRGSAGYGKTYVALDNGFQRETSVFDIGALLDWIETRDDLDASRVAVIGGSYGGYMALASAVHYSDRLRAAVDIVGISNFVTFLENTSDYRRDLRRVEYGDERIPEMREFLEEISPSNNVEKIRIPVFVVQGQNDPRVPASEAEQMVAALRALGETVWYMNALNEGHGYRKKENRDEYRLATMLFFQRYLLGEGAPDN